MNDEVWYWHHMAVLFMALFASAPHDDASRSFGNSRYSRHRRYAIGRKARAVVLFDRVLRDPNSATI